MPKYFHFIKIPKLYPPSPALFTFMRSLAGRQVMPKVPDPKKRERADAKAKEKAEKGEKPPAKKAKAKTKA